MFNKACVFVATAFACTASYAIEFKPVTALAIEDKLDAPLISTESLIDQAIFYISTKSTVGLGIASNLLGCDAENIEFHLGASKGMSESIARACSGLSFSSHPYIGPKPKHAIRRKVYQGKEVKRSYSVVASSEASSFDSWTDARSNKTTLVLDPGKVNFTQLVQQIAHEMAIYFDPKSWINSHEWNQMPEVRRYIDHRSRSEITGIYQALSNPLISHVLSYIRAFKVESLIVGELHREGLVKMESGAYSSSRHPYLSSISCVQECVLSYIETSAENNRELSLPLLAQSPNYRARVFMHNLLGLYPDLFKGEQGQSDIKYLINEATTSYFRQFRNKDVLETMSLFSEGSVQTRLNIDLDRVNRLVTDTLLPQDMMTIRRFLQSEPEPTSVRQQKFLNYLLQPNLRGTNITLSSGPRPRVSGGGG